MIAYGAERKFDRASVGGKGYGLFELVRYGFCVPDFFVIEVGTDLTAASFIDELNTYADKLGGERFSVRSSGVLEDGALASYAGQYHTELNVYKDDLLAAVYRVAASATGKSAKAYSSRMGKTYSDMAIIVQRQIEAVESGVLFSSDPMDCNYVLIERVKGSCDNLVSGRTVPQTLRYLKGKTVGGYEQELVNAAKLLEEKEGGAVDVEWCYDGKLWFLQLRRQTALSDTIPPIPDRNWNLYVYRDFTVFNHSIQAQASLGELQKKLFGFSVPVSESVLVCGREFYSEENDCAANSIWAKLDKGDFFEQFINKIERGIKLTRRRTAEVKKRDYSTLSDRELSAAYKREIDAYLKSYVPMMMRPDDYLSDCLIRLVGEDRANELNEAVKALLPASYYSRERTCFLQGVMRGDFSKYIEKYEWKNNPLGKRLLPVDKKELSGRASGITDESAKRLVAESFKKRRSDRAVAKEIIAQTKGTEERLAELILRFTYLRTHTAEISDRYFYYIRKNLLSQIAKRCRLDDETLLLYRAEEISGLLAGKRLDNAELIKRKSGEAILFFGGQYQTYFGANAYTLLKRLLPAPEQNGTVYGEIACVGEVTGVVKVVRSFSDAENMKKGQILVASMTTPDLTVALEKAVGIITDEGGITCHAAIIAREYAVPCLVGTKTATQVLQDGMIVTLDCVNGCFKVATTVVENTPS
ncbi:MAG: PEP/pyruvate-binding domain-containing protein [Candidatus Coproplasma sp.]